MCDHTLGSRLVTWVTETFPSGKSRQESTVGPPNLSNRPHRRFRDRPPSRRCVGAQVGAPPEPRQMRRHWRGTATMRCRTCWCGKRLAAQSPGRRVSSRPRRFSERRCGRDWGGAFPEKLAAPELEKGSFVRISVVHLDLPLFWQCWKV